MLVFEEHPEKNLYEQGREPTTNSAHIWRRVRESNPSHTGGRRVLSLLCFSCSPIEHWVKFQELTPYEVDFVVGFSPCSEGFSPWGTPVFLPPQNLTQFQIPIWPDRHEHLWTTSCELMRSVRKQSVNSHSFIFTLTNLIYQLCFNCCLVLLIFFFTVTLLLLLF